MPKHHWVLVSACCASLVAGAFAYGTLAPAADAADAVVTPPEPGAPVSRLTRVGDEILFHMRVFDAESRLLTSTRARDLAELEAVKASFEGLFALPPMREDTPQRHVVEDGLRPIPFDVAATVPVGSALVGKPVGHVAAFPIVGRMQDYGQVTTLERARGPFNLTMSLSTQTLGVLTDNATGTRVSLDSVLDAEVLERGEVSSRILILVEDGQVLPVRNTPLHATVRMDPSGERFFLHLDAEEDDEFALLEGCRFARHVLPPGSYRVTSVDEDSVTFLSSPTRWPQLIGRDLIMVLEIVDIVRTEVTEP